MVDNSKSQNIIMKWIMKCGKRIGKKRNREEGAGFYT